MCTLNLRNRKRLLCALLGDSSDSVVALRLPCADKSGSWAAPAPPAWAQGNGREKRVGMDSATRLYRGGEGEVEQAARVGRSTQSTQGREGPMRERHAVPLWCLNFEADDLATAKSKENCPVRSGERSVNINHQHCGGRDRVHTEGFADGRDEGARTECSFA
jgi:hypothetical protein